MAKAKTTLIPKKTWVVMSVLAVGVVATVMTLESRTNLQQYASKDNLNTSSESLVTKNADGTMGPATELENFSNALPNAPKNTLTIKVGSDANASGKETKGKGNQKKANESSEITSLVLTVSKVEVHLAQLNPPQNLNNLPTGIQGIVPSPNSNPKGNPGKVTGADKWETIEIDGETVDIDLVELSKTNIAETLGLASLACGRYTEIRLYVTEATAFFGDTEEQVSLTIPGKSGIVRIVRPFTISPNTPSTITIDFDANRSVVKTGNSYILKPVVAKISHESK
jgi:hypothetical protein